MQLAHLLNSLGLNYTVPDLIEITGIANNSKEVKPGNLFVAISGHEADGHKYIDHAISLGAVAIIGERNLPDMTVPYIQVKNSRKTLALVAKQYYYPKNTKTFIGITGTNGKTTTAFMLRHILENNGMTCSLFSSVYNEVNGEKNASKNTTSDSLELYKQLANSQDQIVILEVTSHALIQHRVEGIEFDCCIFTNLSQDHLDYHLNMEDYFEAKRLLFTMLKPAGKAIINTNNDWGLTLAADLERRHIQTIKLFGEEQDFHLELEQVTYIKDLMQIVITAQQQQGYMMHLSVLGEHNALNATMAFVTALQLSIPVNLAISALESFRGAPGRFERYKHPKGGEVVIDYAHTEDAFFYCLTTAKKLGARRIFHVFGFRGNRDTTKRQSMIDVSLELSDFIILTLDDLNNETSTTLKAQLETYDLNNKGTIITDRISAIKKAWSMMEEGDWLFITGKGQEPYQQTVTHPRSDGEVVEMLLKSQISHSSLLESQFLTQHPSN
ncbi:UDP-N-acetylmuramoyl-L-alanyl-D-glutamate--2,6-diaminopimelate ligase [Alkalicoccobacillus porphyridii]|nr:UDP-N-acetylmuramoyl-L-alanyl-D-glutamate--2,6-diaminopimelate ligase [Alkalicoccobacillus porphyridii]